MEKELKELIRKSENNIRRHEEKRADLRNKLRFCSEHKFEEEQRVTQIRLEAIDGIVYDFQEMIKDLKEIVKSNQ